MSIKMLKKIGNSLRAYLEFGIQLHLVFQILYSAGQLFIDGNGQILNK